MMNSTDEDNTILITAIVALSSPPLDGASLDAELKTGCRLYSCVKITLPFESMLVCDLQKSV